VIPILAVTRWLHEAGLMALFGDGCLRILLRARLPGLELRGGAWRLIVAPLVLGCAILWFIFAAAQMAGDPVAMTDPGMLWRVARQSLFGQIFLLRLGLLILLCEGLALAWRESLVALLSGAALVLISFTGHAAEDSPAHFTAIGATSDGLHLLTGGFWIGGLVLLSRLLVRRSDDGLAARATAVFAEWGMIAVAILILTGMLNATTILLGGEGHDATLYLSVLGAKLVLVTAMLGLALFNHFRLLPGLAQRSAVQKLGRNIRIEFALGMAVVGLAALLCLLQPTFGS
jgi:copper resistance protein D